MSNYNAQIEQIIQEADDLPSLPLITQRILKMTTDEEASLEEMAEIISADAALSVRFLKIVNSAYYGFSSNITNIQQALSILGIMAIRNIAITLSLFDVFPVRQSREYENLFKRALTCAIAADFISQLEGKKAHPDVFLAGLLQNLGMFILMRYLPEYDTIINIAQKFALDPYWVEEAELGTNHVKIGAQIGKRWQLPVIIRASLEYKNNVEAALSLKIPDEAKVLIKATYLGGLAADIFWGWNKAQTIALFERQLTELFNTEKDTAQDVLASLPLLLEDSGFLGGGKKELIPTFKTIQEQAAGETLQSSLRQKQLYHLYHESRIALKRKSAEADSLKEALNHSKALVQKLALKLK